MAWEGGTLPWVVLLAPWLIRLLFRMESGREAARKSERAKLDALLEDADDLLLLGRVADAGQRLVSAAKAIRDQLGLQPSTPLARLHLLEGLVASAEGKSAEAEVSFEAVRATTASLEDTSVTAALRACAEIESARLAGDAETFRKRIQQALAQEPKVVDPHPLGRLAWAALRLGNLEHQDGHWEAARRSWEESIRIAERIETPARDSGQFGWAREKQVAIWADGRTPATHAAIQLADVLMTTGEETDSERWMDRAEALLEGPDHAIAHASRARVLLARARAVKSRGPLGAFDERVPLLERAMREGDASPSDPGRLLAAEAEGGLGREDLRAGNAAGAIQHYAAAFERVRELLGTEARGLAIFLLVARADAHEAMEEHEPATQVLRQAFERARADKVVEVRDPVIEIVPKLHGLLLAAPSLQEARELLAALEGLTPTLSPGLRSLGAVVHAGLTGRQLEAESDPTAAADAFRRCERLAQGHDVAPFRYWERQAGYSLGSLALKDEKFGEAREHLRRALACNREGSSPAEVGTERAAILMKLAECEIGLDRPDEARPLLRRAGEEGVASGSAQGRYLGGIAAWITAGLPDCELDERRRQLDTAARLGRLSGVAAGRELARNAEAALKELSP